MRTVSNILNSKQRQFNQITPVTKVIDALNLLNTLNRSYLIVMLDGSYKGIFSEREYSRNVILKGRHSNEMTVGKAMTTDFPVVNLTDTIEFCINLMNMQQARYLLAFNTEGKLAGVITMEDLLRQVIKHKADVFNRMKKFVDEDETEKVL